MKPAGSIDSTESLANAEPLVAGADPSAEAIEAAEHHQHARDVGRGTILSLGSAVLYTCTNIGLREVSQLDAYWVSCLKAVPTLLAAGALVMFDVRRRGTSCLPNARMTLGLLVTGVVAHLGGNVAFQWGLGIVGLAATVPLTFSMILITGALLGRFWLGEAITRRAIVAMTILTAAFLCVSIHTEQAKEHPVDAVSHDAATTTLAVAVICLSGLAYALLGASIRRTVTGTTSTAAVLLLISIPGVACLGPLAVWQIGLDGIRSTSGHDVAVMLAAGAFNAVAFFMLSYVMKLIPIAYVNVVNASQVAMAAAAGVMFFNEDVTRWLYAGLFLTIAGLTLNGRPAKR